MIVCATFGAAKSGARIRNHRSVYQRSRQNRNPHRWLAKPVPSAFFNSTRALYSIGVLRFLDKRPRDGSGRRLYRNIDVNPLTHQQFIF